MFVDTNVLLYAFDRANPPKQRAAKDWQRELWKSRLGRLSFQVLQEFYVNIVRGWPEAREQARGEIRDLLTWNPVPSSGELLERAWGIQERYRVSFWDSTIVAAAQAAGCAYLLTEDLQAGQDLGGVLVVNPFRTDAESLANAR